MEQTTSVVSVKTTLLGICLKMRVVLAATIVTIQ